ncbi:MAG: hypothetical protein QM802_23740 [Agriterribacter sp.]
MKTLLIIAAICLSSAVVAQKNSSISQTINDDGKKLTIKINGTVDGKKIDYSRKFDIADLSDEEKDALIHHVYDSLGVPFPVAPIAPLPPSPPSVSVSPAAPLPPSPPAIAASPAAPLPPSPPVVAITELKAPVAPGDVPMVTSKSEFSETVCVGGDRPYTKEIKYNPKSGLLNMKYRFIKKGEEVTYEKSVDAKDKSKEQRQDAIKKYEKEIGLEDRDQ